MTHDPVALQDLEQLRRQAKEISGSVVLQHTSTALWQHFADKNTLSKAVGMDSVAYEFEPNEQGSSRVFANMKLMGFIPTRYWELPFEWIAPHYIAVERFYIQGPVRYMQVIHESTDTPEGGSELKVRLRYVPRLVFLPVTSIFKKILQKILDFYQETDQNLPAQTVLGFEAFIDRCPQMEHKIAALTHEWQDLMPDSTTPAKVAEYVYRVPDEQLLHMRPFAIADYFALPRIEVLRFCLLATRAGFFNLSWDVICPSCRGASTHTPHLEGLMSEAHCGACNINYDADFEHNVEVTFRPVERLRTLEDKLYCLNNPGNFSHIWSQLVLDPGEQRIATLPLPSGEYRLQVPGLVGEIKVQSNSEYAPAELHLHLQTALHGAEVHTASHLKLHVHNPSTARQVLRIERLRRRELAASAALVTTLQDFRSLFDAEVLRPGLRLGISNLAVLFSDLKDSTQLYENKGDASAFALVQEHFEIMTEIIRRHEGGIVKTIGDAVMAVFTHNANAVCAALEILKAFREYNRQQPQKEPIIIKLGIHKGHCIALNMNDKLDYFGSNINRAARAQGQSQGDDLILSQAMYEDPGVQACLTKNTLKISDFEAALKGIEQAQRLYCVTLA